MQHPGRKSNNNNNKTKQTTTKRMHSKIKHMLNQEPKRKSGTDSRFAWNTNVFISYDLHIMFISALYSLSCNNVCYIWNMKCIKRHQFFWLCMNESIWAEGNSRDGSGDRERDEICFMVISPRLLAITSHFHPMNKRRDVITQCCQ